MKSNLKTNKIIMRSLLTVCAIIVSFQLVCAREATGQNLKENNLTYVVRQIAVSEAFEQLSKLTGYNFFYDESVLKGVKDVHVNIRSGSIDSILDELSRQTGLSFKKINNTISVSRSKQSHEVATEEQAGKKLTGAILDNNGEPIVGANIVVKGTTIGTITDVDGSFSLDVPEKGTLVISYIGYLTKEIPIGKGNTLKISLQEDTQALEEVVVVGYGTQKKVNLTGAVSSVKFDEEMTNRPITDASQALSGKVSGVWVSQNIGKPGSDEAQLRIRGWGTLNNSDPLVIIDGVEGSFGQVNPNDIESISVLKDAASAAIYGSKAANGVVLVTTKMGKNKEKTQVELNSYVGMQQLGRRYNFVTNSADMMTLINQGFENNGALPLFPDQLITDFRNGTDPYKYPNTDWYDELFHNALITSHNLSIRGGSDKLSSFLSLNYLKQDGILRYTDAQKFGIRANLEYKVNSWFKIGSRLSFSRNDATEPFELSRVWTMLQGAVPFNAPYARDGRFGSVEAADEKGVLLYENHNPLIEAANGKNNTTTDYLSLNAFATVDFTKDLNLQVTWSTIGNWKMTDRYNETLYGYTDSGKETQNMNYNSGGMIVSRKQVSTMRNNFHATLNYSHKFGDKHFVSGVAGLQLENYNERNVFGRRSDPAKDGLTQIDAGTDGIKAEGNLSRLRMGSYFGRLNYAYDDKYLFEMNLRADASSRFKKGNRWGVFPGFSVGWRLSEENFINDLNTFSNLKLRTSWGQLGNQRIDGYWPYLSIFSQEFDQSYSYGGNLASGAAVTKLVDENISWETTSSYDLGLEMGFFDNKLNIEADYFDKKTSDIIVQLPISNIVGNKTAPFENVGEMRNNGFELVVNYDNQVRDCNRLGFNIGANFTFVNNKVTKFQGGNSPDQLYLIREGYSYKSLYGYKAIGIYQSEEEIDEHMHSNSFKPKVGNLKYEDVNNDGKIDYQDKQVLGNTIPKITYGITAGLSYKGFDLNFLFQGMGQANVLTRNDCTQPMLMIMSLTESWKDAWSPENPDSRIPMLRIDSSWDWYDSSFWMHRIDFLKLKNMQLGYAVPEKLSSKLGLSRLYLYANAQNVFTIMWKKGYEGYDPEKDSFNNGSGYYPIPRIFTFGLNINF